MYTLRLIIFCACYCSYAGARNSRQGQPWRNWWEAVEATPNPSRVNLTEKIGEGIKLRAQVLYDSKFLSSRNEVSELRRKTENNHRATGTDNLERYFRALFKEVQQYFNNRSIMINITVQNVTRKDDLVAYYDDMQNVINARETLNNVAKYGQSQRASNDTVFYLFTWPSAVRNPNRLFDYIVTPPNHRFGVSEVATNGTFCSNTTSAALIRHRYGGLNYWSSAKATLFLFGSSHFIFIHKDTQKMNKTFSRCPHYNQDDKGATSTEIPEPPAC
ncbi:uncharacterized protein LOC142564632 isoform X2 [Dermacentor variabilis]|uniref:uncharacterized protein LOC142564632 isoform X2 n=1 Tax=Dermacentor variabilis TaxID=34621 RepID=UPI003F5B01CA